MNTAVCSCGSARSFVYLYYNGKEYRYRRHTDGFALDYSRAKSLLGTIQTDINIKGPLFDPAAYSHQAILERRVYAKMDEWLKYKEKQADKGKIRSSSVKSMGRIAQQYILPFLPDIDVKAISKEHIVTVMDSLPDHLSRKSKKNIMVVFRSWFTWLWQKGIRDIPPFPELEDEDDSQPRIALDWEQQQEALARIPERHRDIIEFGMETGLRPGELITLQSIDFNPRKGTLWVRRTLSGGEIANSTKGKTRIEITLSDRAYEIASRNAGASWLFIHPFTGDRYGVNSLNKIWHKYSGFEVSFYEASRHSFISQLVDDGINDMKIKELARHSDVRTTQRYSHPTRMQEVLNNRGRVIEMKKRKVE
jgi:integrase/recombinase XerC